MVAEISNIDFQATSSYSVIPVALQQASEASITGAK
jgi:hypothetical protein